VKRSELRGDAGPFDRIRERAADACPRHLAARRKCDGDAGGAGGTALHVASFCALRALRQCLLKRVVVDRPFASRRRARVGRICLCRSLGQRRGCGRLRRSQRRKDFRRRLGGAAFIFARSGFGRGSRRPLDGRRRRSRGQRSWARWGRFGGGHRGTRRARRRRRCFARGDVGMLRPAANRYPERCGPEQHGGGNADASSPDAASGPLHTFVARWRGRR